VSPTPGIPDRFGSGSGASVHATINSLDARVARVEANTAQLPQLVSDVGELKTHMATLKGYEAMIKGMISRGILLIIGAVGSAFGVARVTDRPQEPQVTVVQKSATAAKVEACTAMQPGEARDQCAIRILTELMGPGTR